MTNEEIIAKFRHNADGVLSDRDINSTVNAVMELDGVSDFSAVMQYVAASTRTELNQVLSKANPR